MEWDEPYGSLGAGRMAACSASAVAQVSLPSICRGPLGHELKSDAGMCLGRCGKHGRDSCPGAHVKCILLPRSSQLLHSFRTGSPHRSPRDTPAPPRTDQQGPTKMCVNKDSGPELEVWETLTALHRAFERGAPEGERPWVDELRRLSRLLLSSYSARFSAAYVEKLMLDAGALGDVTTMRTYVNAACHGR
eukprot:358247-Chlamydomonas_euryale.AAC.2